MKIEPSVPFPRSQHSAAGFAKTCWSALQAGSITRHFMEQEFLPRRNHRRSCGELVPFKREKRATRSLWDWVCCRSKSIVCIAAPDEATGIAFPTACMSVLLPRGGKAQRTSRFAPDQGEVSSRVCSKIASYKHIKHLSLLRTLHRPPAFPANSRLRSVSTQLQHRRPE